MGRRRYPLRGLQVFQEQVRMLGRPKRWSRIMTSPNTPEPLPERNDLPAVWDLVLEDIKARDVIGVRKYGTRLQPFNGRDSLKDAYQESLDQTVYLRQRIYEEESTRPTRSWQTACSAWALDFFRAARERPLIAKLLLRFCLGPKAYYEFIGLRDALNEASDVYVPYESHIDPDEYKVPIAWWEEAE